MRKLARIVWREYWTRLRSRAFVLSTLGLPLTMAAALAVPLWIASRSSSHQVRIAVVDGTGRIAQDLVRALEQVQGRGSRLSVTELIEHPSNLAAVRDQLRKAVLEHRLDGFLIVPDDAIKTGTVEFAARNPFEPQLAETLTQALTRVLLFERLREKHLPLDDATLFATPVRLGLFKIVGTTMAEEHGQAIVPAILLATILYATLLMYGMTTMRAVIEEKSSRIMEILLSSVRPIWLLTGKILGVGAVGLTQYLIWATAGAILTAYARFAAQMLSPGARGPQLDLPLGMWIWLVVFFLGGYLLYASLYAAVGAAVSSEQDAAQIQMPVTALVIASFVLFVPLMQNPNSTTSIVLSEIPFFSPILMVLRICLETPPLWQILMAILLLGATTTGTVYLAARIYRVGVLVYGKRPSVTEILRWVRYS
jgi:ABC-2 type transport system permease protein